MRNFNFGVKNFRAFDSNGVNLEVAPITILTGCNSSGKSSFVKAIGLLDSFLQQIKVDLEKDRDIQLDKYVLNFKSNQNKLLGNFNNVLNDKNLTEITFSYNIYSLILSCNVNVELTFVPNKDDKLNNGYLKRLAISTNQGIIYSSEKDSDNQICNFNLFKDKAIEFIHLKKIIHSLIGMASSYELWNDVSKDELTTTQDKFKQGYNTSRVRDILKHVRFNHINDNENKYFVKDDWSIIDKFFRTKSLFYIPLINKYKDFTVDNLATEIKQILSKIPKDNINISNLKKALNKIIDDFSNSKHQTFGEYFLEKEIIFLENILQKQSIFPIEESLPTIHPLNTNIETSNLDNLDVVLTNQVSFELLYEIIMTLEVSIKHSIGINDSQFYFEGHEEQSKFHHRLYTSLTMVLQEFLIECLTPNWCNTMQFASSGNVPQRRFYLLDEENQFTSSLKKYFKSYRESKRTNFKDYIPDSFVNKWIQKFGIADKINIEQDSEGFGIIKITLEKDGNIMHLADHGLGITYLVYCMLQIEAAILAAKGENVNRFIGLSDLDGYNESEFHYENQIVAIEEPESHLHPNYQSLLAEMFVEAYKKYKIRFIIETHSEYLIRKLQTLVADSSNEVNSSDINIHYFNHPDPNIRDFEDPQVYQINIDKDGNLSERFGEGFFDEAIRQTHNLLKINLNKS